MGNKIESPEINPLANGRLICNKGRKNGENLASSVSGAWKIGQLLIKERNYNISNTISKTKNGSNVRLDSIKLLEENIEHSLT